MRPLTLIGKSESMLPLTVVASRSASSPAGRVRVMPPLTVVNLSVRSQVALPSVASMEPLTVVASTRPAAEISMSPLTDVSSASAGSA